ncbi:MAG: hypothetical protein KF775_00830 [Cyclobacteriaceae bacterium]|nr:hypothetical protein [Cyclobacteriaceae bacterium]
MNRIDEFFKNKLLNHPVAPPADAWQKVEAGLLKKNNAWVWRLAAALMLFGLLSGMWYWWSRPTEAQPELVQQQGTPQKENPAVVQPEEQKQNLVAVTEKEPSATMPPDKKINKTYTSQTKNEPQPEKVSTEELAALKQTETIVADNTPQAAPARKPIVIEFTLDAIPVRTPEVQVAEVETDKSGLKKILEKARDIKNGESELGSLRDAKNELFAFDFRKDKQKRN